ncbi:MAG: hypothetical protein LAO79_21610 [Acidobacteriia bacterium]|nr:hypothetical protein [Terriglobia bacterium]
MSKEAEKKTTEQNKAAPKRETRAKKQARVVHEIIERVEERLSRDVAKASLGDYLKLVQLEKELEAEDPPEIKVSWVDPETDSEKSE